MGETVGLYYRCSDEELERLTRRQEGRDGPEGEGPGPRLDRAINRLCDEVELERGGLVVEPMTGDRPATVQRQARISKETAHRMLRLVATLPGVSRDKFIAEAIRRVTRLY